MSADAPCICCSPERLEDIRARLGPSYDFVGQCCLSLLWNPTEETNMEPDAIRCESSTHPGEDDVATNPWQCVRCERFYCDGCGEQDEEQTCGACFIGVPALPVAEPADEDKLL